jgi:hypothetical protein
MRLRTARASRSPFVDNKNFGLSGKKVTKMAVTRAGMAQTPEKTLHETLASASWTFILRGTMAQASPEKKGCKDVGQTSKS